MDEPTILLHYRLELAFLASLFVIAVIMVCLYRKGTKNPEFKRAYWGEDKRVPLAYLLGAATILFVMAIISVITLLNIR